MKLTKENLQILFRDEIYPCSDLGTLKEDGFYLVNDDGVYWFDWEDVVYELSQKEIWLVRTK